MLERVISFNKPILNEVNVLFGACYADCLVIINLLAVKADLEQFTEVWEWVKKSLFQEEVYIKKFKRCFRHRFISKDVTTIG